MFGIRFFPGGGSLEYIHFRLCQVVTYFSACMLGASILANGDLSVSLLCLCWLRL